MHSVERTCIVCKSKKNQNEMTRIVMSSDEIYVQTDKKIDGRGAYICKDDKCIDLLTKSKALNRAFKKNISNEKYEEIVNILKK